LTDAVARPATAGRAAPFTFPAGDRVYGVRVLRMLLVDDPTFLLAGLRTMLGHEATGRMWRVGS
jgi:hypothetical protein